MRSWLRGWRSSCGAATSSRRKLAHLAELEERMLHLELGFPSLFAYCVEALEA